MTNISVNNVYVKYIFIYPCSQSKLCLFQNSMIFPWVTDPKFNDFSMIFSFLQISRTFHEIQWFFHDLETDLNFNDFSRAVGTLKIKTFSVKKTRNCRCIHNWNEILSVVIIHLIVDHLWVSICAYGGEDGGIWNVFFFFSFDIWDVLVSTKFDQYSTFWRWYFMKCHLILDCNISIVYCGYFMYMYT